MNARTLQGLMAAFQLLPSILSAVTVVEQAFRNRSGKEKKQLVMAPVLAASQEVAAVAPAISSTIDNVVQVLNTNSLWPKGAEQLQVLQQAVGMIGAVAGQVASGALNQQPAPGD